MALELSVTNMAGKLESINRIHYWSPRVKLLFITGTTDTAEHHT